MENHTRRTPQHKVSVDFPFITVVVGTCTHIINLVPFIMTTNEYKFAKDAEGALCDVAPTILEVMGISQPEEMTGKSLIQK